VDTSVSVLIYVSHYTHTHTHTHTQTCKFIDCVGEWERAWLRLNRMSQYITNFLNHEEKFQTSKLLKLSTLLSWSLTGDPELILLKRDCSVCYLWMQSCSVTPVTRRLAWYIELSHDKVHIYSHTYRLHGITPFVWEAGGKEQSLFILQTGNIQMVRTLLCIRMV
jgi:hypothetical protein